MLLILLPSYYFYLQSMHLTALPAQLDTARLHLRQLELEDVDFLYQLRTDPQVNKYLRRAPPKSKEEVLDFIRARQQEIHENSVGYWMLMLGDELQCIGTICLWNPDEQQSSVDLGYELATEYAGKGYMTEAVTAILSAIECGDSEIQKVKAATATANLASRRLLTRVGMELQKEECGATYWQWLPPKKNAV